MPIHYWSFSVVEWTVLRLINGLENSVIVRPTTCRRKFGCSYLVHENISGASQQNSLSRCGPVRKERKKKRKKKKLHTAHLAQSTSLKTPRSQIDLI